MTPWRALLALLLAVNLTFLVLFGFVAGVTGDRASTLAAAAAALATVAVLVAGRLTEPPR